MASWPRKRVDGFLAGNAATRWPAMMTRSIAAPSPASCAGCCFAARRFYGPRHRLYFRLAALSRSAQQIGIDWYNGADHLDEAPLPSLLAKWARAVLLGAPMG